VVWTAPTINTDGTPIVGAISYRVEQKFGAGDWVTVATVATTQAYVVGLQPGTYTFRVFSIVNGLASDASNTATKDATAVSPPKPNPPAIQVAQVVVGVDHSPVYTVLANGDRSSTVAGMAEVGTACELPVLFTYRNRTYMKPVAWKREKGVSVPLTAIVGAPCGA
jgi:predicted phage tail protein